MNRKSKATAAREAPFRGGKAAPHTSKAPGRRPRCAWCKKRPRDCGRVACRECFAAFRRSCNESRINPLIELGTQNPWETVTVPKWEWNALVAFLRREEKVYQDSYNTPGNNDWEKTLQQDHPEDYKVYYAAKVAADRKF